MSSYFIARLQVSGRYERFVERGFRWKPADDDDHRVEGGWLVSASFPNLDSAIQGVRGMRKKWPKVGLMRIEDGRGVVWVENENVPWEGTTQPQEESMALSTAGGDLEQPLTIPRQSLIDTLQTNLDAEKAEREKAIAAVAARRKEAANAVSSLSKDELLNLVQQYVTADLDDIVKMVEEAGQTGRLKSKDQTAGPKETALEKTVRVLTLANNDVIEVQPRTEIYNLL